MFNSVIYVEFIENIYFRKRNIPFFKKNINMNYEILNRKWIHNLIKQVPKYLIYVV